MKKTVVAVIAFFLLFTSSAYAMDADDKPGVEAVYNFEITGGISDKDVEATFDSYRTITGTAEKDAVVIITLSVPDEDGEAVVVDEYEFLVGASGVFSQDVDLYVGENIVDIIVYRLDRLSNIKTVINRKSIDIKFELEGKNILLPSVIKSGS